MLVTYPSRSPFATWRSFDRTFDRAFAQLAGLSAPRATRTFGPDVAGSWTDEAYQLTVDLPGVADDAVAVSVTGRTLTIDVTTESSNWCRSLRLPQTLDPEQVSARYVNGRLTVTVGRTAQPPAPDTRVVAIDTTPAAPALETSGSDEVAAPEAQAENGDDTSVTG